MRSKVKWLFVVAGCLVILPGLSWAQEKGGKNLNASKIIDMDIQGGKGEIIGEIDDLVIKRNGRVKKATMEVGGFLDIGDKLVAYPFDKLTFEKNKILVDVTQQQLENRKEFDYYEQGLSRGYYYGPYPPYAMPAYGPYYGRRYGPAWGRNVPYQEMEKQRYEAGLWAYSPGRYLASVVIGRPLIDPMGGRLGEFKDLVINEEEQVEKIILQADALGDDVYVVLPYQELGFTYYGVVYDITMDELEKMPKVEYEE